MKIALQGGRVLDPASGLDAVADVVVADGLIVAVGPSAIADHPDAELVDCTGMLTFTLLPFRASTAVASSCCGFRRTS